MRWISPLVLAAAVSAADTPLMSGTACDGDRLRERFNASIYGKLWNDPAMDPFRAQIIAAMDEDADELGFKPSQLFATFRSASASIEGWHPREADDAWGTPPPLFRFQFDFGELSTPLFTTITESQTGTVEVAGFDTAVRMGTKATDPIIARSGNVIVGGNLDTPPEIMAVANSEYDVSYRIDLPRLLETLAAVAPEHEREDIATLRDALGSALGLVRYEAQFVPAGMWERTHFGTATPWLKPVDRQQVGRYPANTLTMLAGGLDGVAAWPLAKNLLALAAKESGESLEDYLTRTDAEMREAGLTFGMQGLIEGLSGTWSLAVTPSAPFPALSICAPRSAVIDALIAQGLSRTLGVDAPAEGGTLMLPIPNLPLPVILARDAHAWLVTTDSLFVGDWLAGTTGGYLKSPAALLASEKGGDDAVILGSSDTAAVLRVLTPFAALGLGQLPLPAEQKQVITTMLQKASRSAQTGYVVVKPDGDNTVMEMQGLITYAGGYAGSLASMVMWMQTMRRMEKAAVEATPQTILRSNILPGQVQLQGGAYFDGDADSIGEYGFPAEMSGATLANGIVLSLLPPDFNSPTPTIDGYHVRVFLPAKDGTGTSDRAHVDADAAERVWVAYVWSSDNGDDRIYAMNQGGNVFSTKWNGEEPAWNALFPDGDWTQPAWPIHAR